MYHGSMDVHWWAKNPSGGSSPLHAGWLHSIVWLEGPDHFPESLSLRQSPQTPIIRSSLLSYILPGALGREMTRSRSIPANRKYFNCRRFSMDGKIDILHARNIHENGVEQRTCAPQAGTNTFPLVVTQVSNIRTRMQRFRREVEL